MNKKFTHICMVVQIKLYGKATKEFFGRFFKLRTLSLQGVKMEAMRFRFDGQPINETDTPSQV